MIDSATVWFLISTLSYFFSTEDVIFLVSEFTKIQVEISK